MKFPALSIILLFAIAGHAFAMSHTPKAYQPPSWSENADASKDATFAIKHKDFRLLAYYTHGMIVPGINQGEKEKLSKKCGLRILEGFGDVIRSQEQLKQMKVMHDYVVKYNKIILPECLRRPTEKQ